jgi:hypothetical protein
VYRVPCKFFCCSMVSRNVAQRHPLLNLKIKRILIIYEGKKIPTCFTIYTSYVSYDIKCHITKNDAYDIEIRRKSIWSILVSKQPSGPLHSHLLIRLYSVSLPCIIIIYNLIFLLFHLFLEYKDSAGQQTVAEAEE